MEFRISDRAMNRLRRTAQDEDVDLGATLLRVAVVPGGCSGLAYELGWDTDVDESDTVQDLEGLRLVIDRRSGLYLDGVELDFTDGLEGRGFHFHNPHAARSCACGESFGV
jgi:iron-sulfur cluster assembly protein